MKKSFKLFFTVLSILLVCIVLSSVMLTFAERLHNCDKMNCSVCLQIDIAKTALKNAACLCLILYSGIAAISTLRYVLLPVFYRNCANFLKKIRLLI